MPRKPVAAAAQPPAAVAPETAAAAPPRPTRPPTEFEARLYQMCKRIRAGQVATYGQLAQALRSSPRAVGQALRRNPYAPAVPCHRVIAASLELGGFNGQWGPGCAKVKEKRALLAGEGVRFDARGRLLDRSCLVSPEQLQRGA